MEKNSTPARRAARPPALTDPCVCGHDFGTHDGHARCGHHEKGSGWCVCQAFKLATPATPAARPIGRDPRGVEIAAIVDQLRRALRSAEPSNVTGDELARMHARHAYRAGYFEATIEQAADNLDHLIDREVPQ